jgi:hypothetical protein
MGLFADTRHWIKDKYSNDEDIHGHPKTLIAQAEPPRYGHGEDLLLKKSPEDRTRHIYYLRSQAILYHGGRHNEPIPQDTLKRLEELDKRVARLNMVDAAREVIKKHGPPTDRTIEDSLRASFEKIKDSSKLRAHDHTYQAAKVHEPVRTPDTPEKTPIKTKQKEHAHEV